MSGIVAVVPASVPPRAPELSEIARSLEQARLPIPTAANCHEGTLRRTEAALTTANTMLATPNAEQRLLSDWPMMLRLRASGDRLERAVSEADGRMDAVAGALPSARLEATQRLLEGIADALWTFRHDRLDRVDRLRNYLGTAGNEPAIAPIWAVTGYSAIEIALRGIDRLEVSGRDSAGLHVWVRGSGVSRLITSARGEIAARNDPLLAGHAVTVSPGGLGFTYKTAVRTSAPGDNARALRAAVAGDGLLARALHAVGAEVSVLAHTRNARIGKISEANSCPVDSTIAGSANEAGPYTVAALSGVIDNHAELRAQAGLDDIEEITTDAKLIPVLLSRNAGGHNGMLTALTNTVASLSGSCALAAQSARGPDTLFLAVRGEARLCVGLSPAVWVVASEPKGLASETGRYLTVGGTPGAEGASSGRIVALLRDGAGDVAGLTRYNLEGNRYPVTAGEVERTQIRVRAADRGPFPHFLLKELAQAPDTVAKTLRGRIIPERDGRRRARLGDAAMSERIVDAVGSGRIRRLLFVGDAAAAVACAGVAATARSLLGTQLRVSAVPASKLSALRPDADLRDCLLVAVSHSGDSALTGHAVDRARALGATVLSMVNHRGSDLPTRSHGVLYLSDDRDDEMAAVATKSLYSQVAAGLMVAVELQRLLGMSRKDDASTLLAALEQLPEQIAKLVNLRGQFQAAAAAVATRTRHWAVLDATPTTIATSEIRRRLAQLCNRPVVTAMTDDDVAHVEPSTTGMLLVCAAGVDDAFADQAEADVRRFSAHDYVPVVIASEGRPRFGEVDNLLLVPETHPSLAWLLSVVAGHLFAYECAVVIDDAAQPIRRALDRLGHQSATPAQKVRDIGPDLREFLTRVHAGALDGCVCPGLVARLARLSAAINAHASGDQPDALLESLLTGGGDDLERLLTATVAELSRPIDTSKQQFPTNPAGDPTR